MELPLQVMEGFCSFNLSKKTYFFAPALSIDASSVVVSHFIFSRQMFNHIKMAIILPTGQQYAPSEVINDAWYCMVLHGIALYCIVLHIIAWY